VIIAEVVDTICVPFPIVKQEAYHQWMDVFEDIIHIPQNSVISNFKLLISLTTLIMRKEFEMNLNFRLPDNVSWEEGAMCEPFAVIVHACRRTNLAVGHNVLVCGAGTMGMMAFLCAKAFGANKVFITDVRKSRLELAEKLGADKTYLIDPKNFDDFEFAQQVIEDMGEAPDVTLECSGDEASTCMAVFATKNGGKVGIVGLGHLKTKVPIVYAAMREVDLIGICRFKDELVFDYIRLQ